MDTNSLFQQIRRNLQTKGYSIQENITYGDYKFQMVGHLSKFELSKFGISDYFFTVGYLKDTTLANIRAFSNQSYSYAGSHRSNTLPPGVFGGYWVFAIILVDQLSDSVRQAIEADCPPKHWSSSEFPVVVEASTGKATFFQGTPTWGMAYYAGFRSLASEITAVK
jgi:hypothetical protein